MKSIIRIDITASAFIYKTYLDFLILKLQMKKERNNYEEKIVALLIAGTMALSLSACGGGSSSDKSDSKQNETTQETKKEEEKAPVDLAGTWKSEDNDGSWMEAVIADDTITVNWVSDTVTRLLSTG